MILVDSTVWIDYFNGSKTKATDFLDLILGRYQMVTGDLIITEVLQGFRTEKDYQEAKTALFKFPVLNMVGEDIAIKSADNYRFLRKQGITIRKTIDCLIATFCIENHLQLLHSDKDFKPFEKHLNLKVIEFEE